LADRAGSDSLIELPLLHQQEAELAVGEGGSVEGESALFLKFIIVSISMNALMTHELIHSL
jgi:hypothetical protein